MEYIPNPSILYVFFVQKNKIQFTTEQVASCLLCFRKALPLEVFCIRLNLQTIKKENLAKNQKKKKNIERMIQLLISWS